MGEVWSFTAGGPLVFGRGSVARLGPLLRKRHDPKRVLLVTDETLVAAGLVTPVLDSLALADIAATLFTGGQPEPPASVVRAAAAEAGDFDAVVGVGGGSNLDVAKLAALLLTHGGDLADYAGENRVPGPVLPIACVPTTAGTGSEVSPAAVFTDTKAGMKVSCLSDFLCPDLALVDPTLTDGCPPQVTADSGIDALAHAIEALCATPCAEFDARPGGESIYQGANPMARLFALECIRLVGRYLTRAVNTPGDTEARDNMARAATLGGLAFSSAGVALCHALEYPVGAAVHVSHGAGNGLLLPHVMRFQAESCRAEHAEIANALGATDAPNAVAELARNVSIPAKLADLGVTRAMLPGFADKSFALKRLLRTTRRPVTSAEELLAVYEAAF